MPDEKADRQRKKLDHTSRDFTDPGAAFTLYPNGTVPAQNSPPPKPLVHCYFNEFDTWGPDEASCFAKIPQYRKARLEHSAPTRIVAKELVRTRR